MERCSELIQAQLVLVSYSPTQSPGHPAAAKRDWMPAQSPPATTYKETFSKRYAALTEREIDYDIVGVEMRGDIAVRVREQRCRLSLWS